MNNSSVITRLELIAAKAKQLALDLTNHKLWEGELQSGLGEIRVQIESAISEAKPERDY